MTPKVSPARRIAFDILLRGERTQSYAGDLLHARLDMAVKPADAALATELTLGVLRWRRLLDFLLSRHISRAMETLDLEVRAALRLGLYQLRYLDRVPAHAAVNESVELVRLARKSSAAGLVNAALRNSVRVAKKDVSELVPADQLAADRLALIHSHPTWMVERWLKHLGEERTIALLEANNRAPQLSCVLLDEKRRQETLEDLQRAGVKAAAGRWLRAALTLTGGNPAASEAIRRGQVMIQDEASQMVPLVLDSSSAEKVLDLCAAPGGKTALLTQAAKPRTTLVAADRHLSRLRAMRARMEAAGISDVCYVALDATQSLPFSARFDRILLDAPCSGTGTLARNPEIRWRLAPADLRDLHEQQVKMLRQASEALAPGGRLVYSTCSLEPEENEQVVREALRANPELRAVSGAAALAPHLVDPRATTALFDPPGFLRTFPPEHGTDGFFVAALERSFQDQGRRGA